MGKLFIVSTPIGNLEDITFRAIKTLFTVDIILCEDTRKTGTFLNYYLSKIRFDQLRIPLEINHDSKKNIKDFLNKKETPRLISYYEDSEDQRIPEIISYLKNGKSIALISSAGTPTISDPGFKLVKECINQGIKVIPIPGPSAILASLVVSGKPTHKFYFFGYLPKKFVKRRRIFLNLYQYFKSLKKARPTVIFFESPHRLIKTLSDLKEIAGDIEIVICRELTKMHEEIWRGKISQAIKIFSKTKGEITLIF